MKIKTGQIVAITTGEYSDYCLRDHLLALKDFDADAIANQFRKERDAWRLLKGIPVNPVADDDYDPDIQEQFLAWLADMGYVSFYGNVVELHIGSYSGLSLGQS